MDVDNSDNDSVVTNSTFNDPTTELVPSLQHHLKEEQLLPAEICSPLIPIATSVLRNIKCASLKNVELQEDNASNDSSASQSLLTTNNRSNTLNFSVIPFSEKVDEWKEVLVDRRKNLKENKDIESNSSDDDITREITDRNDPVDDTIPQSDGKKTKLISQESYGGGSVSLISHSPVGVCSPDRVREIPGIITESQETCMPGLETQMKQSEVNLHQENQVASQSTSSISSLGDINDSNDNNYKKKEEDILSKVEKMQNKIQKKLSSVSRTSAQDSDVFQQKFHAIKSMLIRIAERHKVERNKITIDIKRSGKLKSEKIALKHSLQELSVRQESLFKLFQKHKEITRLMKKDSNFKESFGVVPITADKSCRGNVKMVGGLNKNITKYNENVKSMKITATPNRTGNKTFVEEQNFNNTAQKSRNDKGSVNIEPLTEDPNYTVCFNGTRELYSEMEDNGNNENVTQSTCIEDLDMDVRDEERDRIESSLKRTGLNVTSIPLHKSSMYNMKQAGSQEVKSGRKTQQLEIHDKPCCDSDLQISQQKFSDAGNFDQGCPVKQSILKQPVQPMLVLQNENTEKSSLNGGHFKSKPTQTATVVPPSATFVLSQNTDSNESLSLLGRQDMTQKNSLSFLSVPFSSIKKSEVIEIDNDIDVDVEVSKTYQTNTRGDAREDAGGLQGQGLRNTCTADYNQMNTEGKQTNTEMQKVGAPNIGNSYNDGRIKMGKIITNKVRDTERDNSMTSGGVRNAEVGRKTNKGRVIIPKLTYSHGNEVFNKINRKREMTFVGKKITTAGGKKIRSTTPNEDHRNTDNQNFHGGLTYSSNRMREDGKTHNEMMRTVIDKAMKIISEKPSGAKPSFVDVNSTHLEQARLYRAEQNKTPPLSPREGYNDISPSVASFATFRSAFTEHFPVTKPSTQEPDLQDMFNGLKYPPLHLLINKGIIKTGRNILTAYAKGKEYRSSLTVDGYIESLGGELFLTPVKWLAAILGKPVPDVKKSQAYKQVHYRGMSLISILKEPTLVVHDEEDDNSQDENKEIDNKCDDTTPLSQSSFNDKVRNTVHHSTGSLKIMLHMSNIKLLDVTDFTNDNDLPENFWNDDFCKVKLSEDLWKDVDNWN